MQDSGSVVEGATPEKVEAAPEAAVQSQAPVVDVPSPPDALASPVAIAPEPATEQPPAAAKVETEGELEPPFGQVFVTCDDVPFTVPKDCTGTKLTELFKVDEKKLLCRRHEGRADEQIAKQGAGSLTLGNHDVFITK
jgi:hypothetical protein